MDKKHWEANFFSLAEKVCNEQQANKTASESYVMTMLRSKPPTQRLGRLDLFLRLAGLATDRHFLIPVAPTYGARRGRRAALNASKTMPTIEVLD
jgi:hypothetical protein